VSQNLKLKRSGLALIEMHFHRLESDFNPRRLGGRPQAVHGPIDGIYLPWSHKNHGGQVRRESIVGVEIGIRTSQRAGNMLNVWVWKGGQLHRQ